MLNRRALMKTGAAGAAIFTAGLKPLSVSAMGDELTIAYNVNLATSDIRPARQIARAIRSSSGGLPHVKAMGVSLKRRNQVQVSVNLTDFEISSIQRVFQAVCREAERLGTRVSDSEIVGLVPRRALPSSLRSSLRLKDFRSDLVFENRLAAYLKQQE